MGHGTQINGVRRDITGGMTLVNGVGRKITKGLTLVNGVQRDINIGNCYIITLVGSTPNSSCFVEINGVRYQSAGSFKVPRTIIYCQGIGMDNGVYLNDKPVGTFIQSYGSTRGIYRYELTVYQDITIVFGSMADIYITA